MTAPQQHVPELAVDQTMDLRAPTVTVGLRRPQGENLGTIDGALMAQIGAEAAALGMTHDQVIGLIRTVETNAINTTMGTLPRILKEIQAVHAADLHQIAMQIQGLQQVQIPPTGIRSMFGVDLQSLPRYVDIQQVLNIIAQAKQRIAPAA